MQLGADVGQLVAHSVSVVPLSQPPGLLLVAEEPPRLALPPVADAPAFVVVPLVFVAPPFPDVPPRAELPPLVDVPLLAVLFAEVEPPKATAPPLVVAGTAAEVPPPSGAFETADAPPFELVAPTVPWAMVELSFPPAASDESPPDRDDALFDVAAPP